MKYLFTVLLSDGTYIEQTSEDICKADQEARAKGIGDQLFKSAYYDVLEAEKKGNKPMVFVLMGDNKDYLIDLRDGHFEVNGAPFYMHEHNADFKEYRLIYYRNRRKFFDQAWAEVGEETIYNIGWQATVNGENVQYVLSIK